MVIPFGVDFMGNFGIVLGDLGEFLGGIYFHLSPGVIDSTLEKRSEPTQQIAPSHCHLHSCLLIAIQLVLVLPRSSKS